MKRIKLIKVYELIIVISIVIIAICQVIQAWNTNEIKTYIFGGIEVMHTYYPYEDIEAQKEMYEKGRE